ncbi:protein Mis18-alpha [Boleophthalmus pectinirostris]|uniref:protein Mis18-alpha n=1 Tax=Boleophthalmus pectinirostris TaxID=150288 RepID=UPI00242C5538|nr:protein Mis18-alpha [Boleophthalmus pectinirostris]
MYVQVFSIKWKYKPDSNSKTKTETSCIIFFYLRLLESSKKCGTEVQMATREKIAQQHPAESLDKTFDTSTNPSIIEERLFGHNEEEEADDDGPVVFFCGKCKLPVGDSFSWDGSEDSQNQIRLKKITDNVVVGKEKRMYEPDKKSPCLVVDLICQGCRSVIGVVYSSTPKQLDHKRYTFCLNVADIDSYVLGSANQMLSAEGPDEQPVTLEYRGIVEQQLREIKLMVVSMAQRLEEIESGL